MSDLLEDVKEVIVETLTEEDLISHSVHKKTERVLLWIRNIAVACAVVLFVTSLAAHHGNLFKSAGYFCGAVAYFCELLMLTDCFRVKMPHEEMFMAYCFGPLYILLGISYLFGH